MRGMQLRHAASALALGVGICSAPLNDADAGFEEGVAAYESGDYALALREWEPLAAAGDARAQFNLGVLYAQGQGVAADPVRALDWYRKAAEQGYAAAQNSLAARYEHGIGVPRDDALAAVWYEKAASQGASFTRRGGGCPGMRRGRSPGSARPRRRVIRTRSGTSR
jgi:TPR repeat protein